MNIITLSSFNKTDFSALINNHKFKLSFLVFVAYLCLSLYKIGDNSLWFDEGFSIDIGNDSIKEILYSSLNNDPNPPLYLIIVHFWVELFGETEAALRSLSAVATSLACSAFFLFCLRFFNWQTAIFSALLFFTSNELFYYSQEGRTFGLVILFCVLSIFSFMSLINDPNWKNAILLGIFNSVIFYLHTLACLWFVPQLLLIPFLAFNKSLFLKKSPAILSFLGYKIKHILYYALSWLTFGLLFWPWKERFFGLIADKGKGFWLAKPTFDDVKSCLFDFCNSRELFFVYIITFVIIFLLIICLKKLREPSFDYKLLIIAIMIGPFLVCLNYFISENITAIFLKRYILFTVLGFVITYSYLLSILKLDFRIKSALFLILVVFSARKMVVPKESYYDFKDGVELLKKAEGPNCYISTDMPTLYAYYRDREVTFKAKLGLERDNLLAQFGVHCIPYLSWPNSLDYSKYTDVYYTQTFAGYGDPRGLVDSALNSRLILVEKISIKGIQISHYCIPITDSVLTAFKNDIINNKEWLDQITKKAKEWNMPVDSMITRDAIWNYKLLKKIKK